MLFLSYVFGAIEEGLNEREKELKAQKFQSEKKEKEAVANEGEITEIVDQSNKNIQKMTKITASEVNKLRKQTGAGMMDCKISALVEA